MTLHSCFFVAFLLMVISFRVVDSKAGEWYQACSGDECGYSRNHVSSSCRDSNEHCRQFALRGECLINPVWMNENCRRSCGQCAMDEIEDEPCEDLHTACPLWASEMECFANPAYMSRACPKSCWLCANATDLAETDGLSKEDIEHLKKFANTDFGLWQAIPKDDPGDVIRTGVKEMGRYARSLKKIGPGTLCNNQYHECVQWVFEKGCNEELEFMLTHCSLACQQCDIVDEFKRCAARSRLDSELYGNAKNIFMHLFHRLEAENLLEGHLNDLEDGEWVLSLEHDVLWENSHTEIQGILSSISKLQWKDASAVNHTDNPEHNVPAREGFTATCYDDCRKTHPSLNAFYLKIAAMLQVNPRYLMPLEFVHYKRGERFATHHDYRLHDQWRHSGRRAISVFINLKKPISGGSFGFPDLEWLLVEDPKILVWPNISPKNPNVPLGRLRSEQLPVVEGEMYGVYTWVREYAFDDSNPCA